jgi:YidC/Oxa1 family membrane protein insertase
MDRQSVLGYILIFVLLVAWMLLNAPHQTQQPPKAEPPAQTKQVQVEDTVARKVVEQPKTKTVSGPNPLGKFFNGRGVGQEKVLTIETDLFTAEITTKGGLIKTWTLRKYTTWDDKPVELVDYEKGGDLSLLFTTSDGRLIDTRDLYFNASYAGPSAVKLTGDQEFELDLTVPTTTGGELVKHLSFKNGVYGVGVEFRFTRMADAIANYEYQVVWESGLRYAERNSVDESSFAAAYAYAGKELTELDASSFDEKAKKEISGVVDWVAARTKYFAIALIPKQGSSDGAYLEGTRQHAPDKGVIEKYSIAIAMPFKGGASEVSSFQVFIGPIDYDLLKSYEIGLERIVSLGWTWLRPISEYIMLPMMNGIHYLVPNWGLVIIIFSVIIKVVLHPLTRSSMRSMKKMQALQPLMNEIREKYKEDPQKMNQQIMNLYKEYGVNPAGGCLPLLLQFPILIALYTVFRSTIELRQANFVWWITDLSVPDRIATLPFEIPFFGVRDISGLALLMGVTMFIQQKMSVKDPRQKTMVWMMPILMTLLFNGFPAGLNLYYFVFNVLSIGQQIMINRQAGDEPLRKVEQKRKKRGGVFGKITKDLPRLKR